MSHSPTAADALTGLRVQVPAHTDAWMRGDRYGTVAKVNGTVASVRLDKSGKTLKVAAEDLRPVETH